MTERTVFLEALEIADPAERRAYLDRACAGDADLRRKVQSLLAAHERPGNFLERPAPPPEGTVDEAPASPSEPQPAEWTLADGPGVLLAGRYKLLEAIGEGGMGAVWMAQQTEPVKRLVAVKLIKPGMDSGQVLARFEAERQALALMDHPNIARVFDGGAAPDGRPFFVMELVKGVPITRYCDDHCLTPRQRLELFVGVCQAVQHAHHKGIIHRDLKPANVLVAPYDGQPVVKVIDFGIAKATGQPLTDKTLFTGFGAVVGTLEYMSPEQAELNNHDIDTHSDIYSLGVLLYELLTGTTPLTRQRVKEGALLEVLRLIREEEAPTPSTRLSTTAELPAIAANRGLEPKKLSGLVRGELDWIVMKALEKDRSRRYDSANGLAADVQRYLADEPVLACPPSPWYRLRKFARRNRAGLATAALVLLCLAMAAGGLAWAAGDRAARRTRSANDLERALDRAELLLANGRRTEALAALGRAEQLAGDLLGDPERDERLGGLKERLAAEARDQQFIDRFEKIRLDVQGQVDVAANRFTMPAAFPAIGDALRAYGIDVGGTAAAEAAELVRGRPEAVRRELIAALEECLRLAPAKDAATRPWLLATLEAADGNPWRARARRAVANGDTETLAALADEADVRQHPSGLLITVAVGLPVSMRSARLGLLRRVQRAYPADLWSNDVLARELRESGQPAEAVRYCTAALAVRPRNPGIYFNRGTVLQEAGELDEAIADFRQAVALAPGYTTAHYSLGNALYARGKLDEAITAYRQAIRLRKDFAEGHNNLGNALKGKGRLDEAIAAFRKAIDLDPKCAQAYYNLGNALSSKGRLDEAIAEYREALRLKKEWPEAHYNLGNARGQEGLWAASGL